MNRREHRLAAFLDGAEIRLQRQDMAAQRLGAARRFARLTLNAGEHCQIDPGTEMLAMGRQNDRADGGLAVGPLEAVLQFAPHGRAHRVGLVGTVEEDLGDVTVDAKVEGFEARGLYRFLLHGVLVTFGAAPLPGAVKGGWF